MKIFYSRKLLGMRRYSSWIPMTSVLLVILVEIMAAFQDVWTLNQIPLRLTADFAPLILCIVGICTDKGKGFHVFLKNDCGKLYLLPPKDFVGRSEETLILLEERMVKSNALPMDAREIQHTLSLRKIGPLFWLRCTIEGKNRIINLMFTENYGDWEELSLLLEEKE